jgi:hypothetical protein
MTGELSFRTIPVHCLAHVTYVLDKGNDYAAKRGELAG